MDDMMKNLNKMIAGGGMPGMMGAQHQEQLLSTRDA